MSRIKLALIMPWRENKGVANLNGIYTDGFWGVASQEIFGGNLL
ncbi:hypothetical protein [Prevotella sp. P4-119]|nr:hypothetical protein [Prevotella sp. P4-119]